MSSLFSVFSEVISSLYILTLIPAICFCFLVLDYSFPKRLKRTVFMRCSFCFVSDFQVFLPRSSRVWFVGKKEKKRKKKWPWSVDLLIDFDFHGYIDFTDLREESEMWEKSEREREPVKWGNTEEKKKENKHKK